MGMGTRRRRERQEQMWIAHQELAKGPAHPFYQRVSDLLEEKKFDEFAEKECAKFYAVKNGRPSLTPGLYFRLLLVGYFEGIDSERGIAWRAWLLRYDVHFADVRRSGEIHLWVAV